MLKAFLRRLRQFMAADVTAALDRLQPELHAARAETAALRGDVAALRAELAARDAQGSALSQQMEAALLTIALNRRAAG
jgi:hypothetical protein